jgi:hypothetical protein
VSDPFRRARAGEPLRVSSNAWNDITRQTADRKRQGDRPSPLLAGSPLPERLEILVYNATDGLLDNTNSDFRLYDVVSLHGPVYPIPADNELAQLEFARHHVLKAIRPLPVNSGLHSPRFGVCLEPIEPGRIGRVAFRGITIAKVTAPDDAKSATVELNPQSPNYQKLTGGAGTVQILWKMEGDEDQLALVCLDARVRTFAWCMFEEALYATAINGFVPAILVGPPANPQLIGVGSVFVSRAMLYLAGTRYLCVLDEDGNYNLVDRGVQVIRGVFDGTASSGTIATHGVNVNVTGGDLGNLTDGAPTIAIYDDAGYVVVAQGCA